MALVGSFQVHNHRSHEDRCSSVQGTSNALENVVATAAGRFGELPMNRVAPVRPTTQPPLLDRYQPLIGERATERLLKKAGRLNGIKVLHVNSTREGGGVAEILRASRR